MIVFITFFLNLSFDICLIAIREKELEYETKLNRSILFMYIQLSVTFAKLVLGFTYSYGWTDGMMFHSPYNGVSVIHRAFE